MTDPGDTRRAGASLDAIRATLAALVGDGEVPRLEEALTHPSFANEASVPDNQRLEFLGDAVLGLCVSEILQASFPDADEGTLTRMRAALVNADALAEWARRVSLGDALFLGRGARAGGERSQTNVLADAVEAVVAAVYVARGLDGARALVREIVSEPLREVGKLGERDAKSLLQERVQKNGLPAPVYRVKESRGPAHDPTFVAEVLVDGEVRGTGEGKSKRSAERAAAEAALSDQGFFSGSGAPSGGT
jgi:ribonuclease-3